MRWIKVSLQLTVKSLQFAKGQTLVEVLIALAVVVIVMTAITTAVLTALNNSQFSKLQNQATQYAQQGMEYTQSYRDAKSFSTLLVPPATTVSKCMPATCSPATPNFDNCFTTDAPSPGICAALIESIFERRVTVSNDASCGATKKVQVAVRWNDGKCDSDDLCHTVNVTSCMADSLRPGL